MKRQPVHSQHKPSWSPVRCAIHVMMESNYVHIDDPELQQEPEHPFISSQDDVLFRKESFLNLSEEAKLVINLILKSPQEVVRQFLTPVYGAVSRKRLRRYIRNNLGWSRKKILKTFDELRNYANNLD